MADLLPCPFCSKTMMLRSALWPSEGDADAIIHAFPTDCPMVGFSDGSADGSIIEKWNCSLSNEDDFPSDGSCVRCGSVPRNANGLCNTCLDEDAERLENTRTTPVAPVSPDTDGKCGELVTVAKQHRLIRGGYPGSWQPYASPIFSDDVFETRELVTRSQAEELLAAVTIERDFWKDRFQRDTEAIRKLEAELAAERAEKDGWKELHHAAQVAVKERTEACNSLYRQNTDLEAKLAAKDARIKELEETKAVIAADKKTLLDLAATNGDKVTALEAKLAAAEKINDTMRKAAVDYCWQRYKSREPMNLKDPAVFTSHEWEKIGEAMDAAARSVLGGKPS